MILYDAQFRWIHSRTPLLNNVFFFVLLLCISVIAKTNSEIYSPKRRLLFQFASVQCAEVLWINKAKSKNNKGKRTKKKECKYFMCFFSYSFSSLKWWHLSRVYLQWNWALKLVSASITWMPKHKWPTSVCAPLFVCLTTQSRIKSTIFTYCFRINRIFNQLDQVLSGCM